MDLPMGITGTGSFGQVTDEPLELCDAFMIVRQAVFVIEIGIEVLAQLGLFGRERPVFWDLL
jgi:hypothetical protein